LESELNAGGSPEQLVAGDATADGWVDRSDGIDQGLADRHWFRMISKGVLVAIVISLIIAATT